MIETDKPTIYQFFEEHGLFMMTNGIISADRYMVYIRYKVYLDFIAQGNSHPQSVIKASARMKCGTISIYRSIKFMTDPDWRRENGNWRINPKQVRNHKFPNPAIT